MGLCLGHARANDKGAVALNGVSEEEYNTEILTRVAEGLAARGVELVTFFNYQGLSYGSAMRWIAQRLREEKVTLAIEFHFNAANPSVRGFEYLHWHKSTRGVKAAVRLQEMHRAAFPWQYDRGVEPLGDQAHERGVLFTSLTHCPAVLAEPFFGTNQKDMEYFFSSEGRSALVAHYVRGIVACTVELGRT